MFVRSFGVYLFKYLAVGAGVQQAVPFRKRKLAHQCQYLASGCETLATFSAATVDNVATAFGGHARAKAVSTLALQYAGLKCSFHD